VCIISRGSGRCSIAYGQACSLSWASAGRRHMSVAAAASGRQYSMALSEAHPELMRPVREVLRAHLRLWRKAALTSAAELGLTELLTNVYKHAPGTCELLVRETPDGIVVEVTDAGRALPTVKEPA